MTKEKGRVPGRSDHQKPDARAELFDEASKVELRLGTGQYFTGYNADSDEPYYLKGASMDEIPIR